VLIAPPREHGSRKSRSRKEEEALQRALFCSNAAFRAWFAKKRVSPDRDLELVSSFCPPLDPLLVLGDAPLSVELKIIHEEHSWPQRTAQRNDFLAVALV
jgi:hypothetical protein